MTGVPENHLSRYQRVFQANVIRLAALDALDLRLWREKRHVASKSELSSARADERRLEAGRAGLVSNNAMPTHGLVMD